MSTSSSSNVNPSHSASSFFQAVNMSTHSLKEIFENFQLHISNFGFNAFIEALEILVEKEFDNSRFFEEHETKVLILNILAGSSLTKGLYSEEEEERNERFSKCMHFINRADRIDIQQGISFALKGFLLFYQGQYDKAPRYFDQSLLLKSNYIFAFIGKVGSIKKAICAFSSKNYEESILNFRLALEQDADLPDEVYFGLEFKLALAISYFFNENFLAAKLVVETLLQFQPNNMNYKLLLASIFLQSGEIESYLKIHQASQNCELCPFLLNLAEIYLLRGNYGKVYFSQRQLNWLTKGLNVSICGPEL